MTIALPLHVLAAVIWVGGMFFAHHFLRPNLPALQPADRLRLVRDTLRLFFRWVWIAIAVLWLTGIWIVAAQYGFNKMPWHVLVMMLVAALMTLVFCLVYFDHFRKICDFLDNDDLPAAGDRLGRLSKLVSANLVMGLIVVAVAATRGIIR